MIEFDYYHYHVSDEDPNYNPSYSDHLMFSIVSTLTSRYPQFRHRKACLFSSICIDLHFLQYHIIPHLLRILRSLPTRIDHLGLLLLLLLTFPLSSDHLKFMVFTISLHISYKHIQLILMQQPYQ